MDSAWLDWKKNPFLRNCFINYSITAWNYQTLIMAIQDYIQYSLTFKVKNVYNVHISASNTLTDTAW